MVQVAWAELVLLAGFHANVGSASASGCSELEQMLAAKVSVCLGGLCSRACITLQLISRSCQYVCQLNMSSLTGLM